MSKKNPYNSQKTFSIAEEERAARNKLIEPASGALARYYSPEGMSEYAKTQQTLRESDTNKAFNNSLAANRMRARMAGFGYEQPLTQAGDMYTENARAAELARIPAETQSEAARLGLQAIGQQQGFAGMYQPMGYYNTGAQQYENEAARRGGLWRALSKVGLGVAGRVIPGAAPFTSMASRAYD
jgi:hypothetical protein